MADKFDGSINIDSRVNTNEFKKGVREIEEGAKQLEKTVNEAGKGMQSAGTIDTKGAQKALDEIGAKSSEVHAQTVKELQDEATLRENLIRSMNNVATKANIGTDDNGQNPQRMSEMSESLLEERTERAKQAVAEMQAALDDFKKNADAGLPENAQVIDYFTERINSFQNGIDKAEQRLAEMRSENIPKIVVDTEVDTQGLKAGTSEMNSAMDSIRAKFDEVEATIRNKFNGMFETPKQEAKEAAADINESVSHFIDTSKIIGQTDNMREMILTIEQMRYELAKISNTKFNVGGEIVQGLDTEEFKTAAEIYEHLSKKVFMAAKNTQIAVGAVGKAGKQAVERFNETAKSFDGASFEKQGEIINDLKTQFDLLKTGINGIGITTDEEITKAEEKLKGLSDAYKEAAKNQSPEAAAENQNPPYTAAWDAAIQKIQQAPGITQMASNAMGAALNNVATIAGGAMAKIGYAIHNPAETADKAFGSMARAAGSAVKFMAGLGWGSVTAALKGIATKAKNAAINLASMAKNAVVSGLGKLKDALLGIGKGSNTMGTGMKRNFMTVLKYAFGIRSLYMLFRKLRSAITEGFTNLMKYDTEFAGTVNNFKASLATLKNAFAAAVAPIVQAVLPMITQFIDMLTAAVSRVGMLVSALTGKGTYLKAAKQQAAATDGAADSFNNEAKAAKEAQKTIAGFDDLTILNDNEDNSSPASKSGAAAPGGFDMEPVTEEMAGLADALKDMWDKADFTELGRMLGEKLRDALNSIPWDKIKEVMRKIGKSIATFLNGFLETPGLFDAIGRTLAEALNSAFEFLYAFVSNFHWDSLGRAIVDGILGFLNNIDWGLIQATFKELGAGIATTIGTVFSDPNLPLAIGQALANVINTAWIFFYSFVATIPWENVGTFIRDGLLSLLNNIDWTTIYATFTTAGQGIGTALEAAIDNPEIWTSIATTFSNAFRVVVMGIFKFITSVDWGSIGHNIGLGLNAGVATFPWNEIASTITAALNGAFSFIYNWLTTVDFKAIGGHIGTAISTAIHDFDWNTAGAALGAACTSLFDFLNGLMETIDWKALGAGVIKAISGFFGEFDWASVGEFVSNLIIGLFNFLTGAIQEVDWGAVPGQIVQIISEFMSGVDWGAAAQAAMGLLGSALGAAFKLVIGLLVMAGGAIYEAFQNIIDGGLQGIIDGLAGIGKWIIENIFDPFIKGFKEAFGIASPSKEMEPLGGYIVDGLLNGILAPFKGIFKWLNDHVASPIIDGVCKLFGIGSGKTALENPGSLVTDGLKNGISGAMAGIHNFIKGTVTDPVEDAVENGLGTRGTPVTDADGKAIVDGLKSGMDSGASGMDRYISSTVTDPVLSGIRNPFGISGSGGDARQFADYGRYAMEGLKAGLSGGTDAVLREMMNIAQKIPDVLKQIDWSKIGEFLTGGISEGIGKGASAVLSAMADMANRLGDPFKNINWFDIGDFICGGIQRGLFSGWRVLTDTAWNMAVDIFNSACNALGIASPSKEFYWVAEMITAGITGGLEDTSGDAVDAISATTNAITKEAENASPIIPIQTALDGSLITLDETMMNFADRVVGGFEAMIAALENLASTAAFSIPQAAMGSITPYAARVAAANSAAGSAPDTAAIMELIAQQSGSRITRDELEEIMRGIAQDYFNFDFYFGDEQVARSANRGNARLNRRFSPTI